MTSYSAKSAIDEESPPVKRRKLGFDNRDDEDSSGPTRFVTWNANGFISRCKYNRPDMEQLLIETRPDIMCIQEARLKSCGPANRGQPLPSELMKDVEQVLGSVFRNYTKVWSLCDTKRYAGTLTLVHNRIALGQDVAFCPQAAIELLLRKFGVTRQAAGLPAKPPNNKPATPVHKQTSIRSFFARKGQPQSESDGKGTSWEHHHEGRFQFLSFSAFDLINTYQPNNGTTEEMFQRRRDWDAQMQTFLLQRKKILDTVSPGNDQQYNRPLLWCGDMNVARDYRDGTHWKVVKSEEDADNDGCEPNSNAPGIYEWFRDEKACLSRNVREKVPNDRHPGDIGIPSFTTNERVRFESILNTAQLSDVWRCMHPNGVLVSNNQKKNCQTLWDLPNYTWRGHLSANNNDGLNSFVAKYEGKGQRLDYFLLSAGVNGDVAIRDLVERCDILGYGTRREGLFCGSDHCAALLVLKEPLS